MISYRRDGSVALEVRHSSELVKFLVAIRKSRARQR